ncbi:MAG: sigma 54-interacting transcriptional regulator, partial [Acidobacteriota bacterium]|nr:sigma 54-interacting transcriptional regulator [Acidobacteriota bacterium]
MTGLPGRRSFQALLAEELDKACAEERSLSTLLINPDDFVAVNERAGREEGDEVVREAVTRLRAALRSSDIVARYGGVTHAVLLLDTSVEAASLAAEKVLRALSANPFLSGSVRLGFSVGVAGLDPSREKVRDPLDLLHRADQALKEAKRSGGGRVVVWKKELEAGDVGQFDRLAGIFTGEIPRDYRNMTLLWDAVNVMATSEDFDLLAAEIAGKLYTAFALDRVGLFGASQAGDLRLLSGLARGAENSPSPEGLELGAPERDLLERGCREKRALEAVMPAEGVGRKKTHAWFGPFLARQRLLGGLYLARAVPLDSSDVVFLRALASQLAVVLDRMLLSEQEKVRLEQDRLRLRAERDELQKALRRAKLEYRSAEMERVVSTARRVAPTDATVLIMGESGTGKELLARTIHELSRRHNRPYVVVDCGAIAATLADSELFGRERGAYTGADERRAGRLVEADGGTVLLDEIGELPLEVQTKLLRFAQEKQVTAVGGTRPRRVDVRILAATNRDLGAEVAAGRFRADLYHRLNVVRLVVPPLRERPDDILFLAAHFLETFSTLHGKKVRRLTPEGEALLLREDWLGNVRELQNRLMQAVILCEG